MTILVGAYPLRDVNDALRARDRQRRCRHNAFIKVCGGSVFLYVKDFVQ